MSELEPIYCPLCRAHICNSEDPIAPQLFFGCGHCGILFRIILRDADLSEALRIVAAMPKVQ